MSGNVAIIASNQNHQCSITPCGAELKCGCRVVVMGNLCFLNCPCSRDSSENSMSLFYVMQVVVGQSCNDMWLSALHARPILHV